MSVMPVFGAEGHAFLHMENVKKGKNRIDNIAGGGILNNGNNKRFL